MCIHSHYEIFLSITVICQLYLCMDFLSVCIQFSVYGGGGVVVIILSSTTFLVCLNVCII